MEQKERMQRWRMILGKDSQEKLETMGMEELTETQQSMDEVLGKVYQQEDSIETVLEQGYRVGMAGRAVGKTGGNGPSQLNITKWFGDLRQLFDRELVKVIQEDALKKCGFGMLLFQPEVLESLEPNIDLAAKMLTLRQIIPEKARENVREFIRKIVEEIRRMLEPELKSAVAAALNRRKHSVLPSARAVDYKRTIEKNLKNYNAELGTIIPEQVYFFDRAREIGKWTVILDIDQSASMGRTVIHSSVVACILASISKLKTKIVAFDTNVVDLTEKSDDPVNLLYGIQLGGGTDINRSIAYCQQLVENPEKTLFFLISDLYEGGNQAAMLRRLYELKESGVTVISLLALEDDGVPSYDEKMAQKVAALGIPCFACNPQKLPEVLHCVFSNGDLKQLEEKVQGN